MIKYIVIILSLFMIVPETYGQTTNKQAQNSDNMIKEEPTELDKLLKIANADYGTCYTIGNYMLCPEKKLIRVMRMFGTATIDCVGFFPDTSLNYDSEIMIIFAGQPFFDKSDLKIDWQKVTLLSSYENGYFEFTDGETLYYMNHGDPQIKDLQYDKNSYELKVEEKPEKHNRDGVKELTEDFCVKGNKLYFGGYFVDDFDEGYVLTPILESFDVPNLRTITSESGFETNYITDGKKVIFGGGKTGYTTERKRGVEYVKAEEWIINGIDFTTLRVLGKNMLADKNALYYGTEVIPFDKLNGFKFIIREIE